MDAAAQRGSEGDGGSGRGCTPEPRYLAVGRILRPHGIRGELRVEILTDYPERLGQCAYFYLAYPDSPESVRRYPVEKLRRHKKVLLLKLGGCDDRNGADELRGMLVQIPLKEAAPLEEGEYYHFQLIGVRVETEHGEWLGQVVEVLETGANDVYVVRGPWGEVLLPAVNDVILELDLELRRMVVHLLPGMLAEDKR
ncbi:MAG: 16S rRNA processing protein RimM [Anaerolineae bacterium]|nr:16S rRNA processing protein RimM [Anaerolineae bacterium]